MLREKEPFITTLRPGMEKTLSIEYDEIQNYNLLHKISKELTNLKENFESKMDIKRNCAFYESLSKEESDNLLNYVNDNPELLFNNNIINIIEKIITPEMDLEIKNFFKSNYAILWYSSHSVNTNDISENCSAKWHCDGGPSSHLKVITYLNDHSEHKSSTLIMDIESTEKLKEVGYIYSDVRDRILDISDLLEYYNIEDTTYQHKFKKGESILFSPTQTAHRADPPKDHGVNRTTFNLCIIPSPMDWKSTIKCGYIPANQCIPFENQPKILLDKLGIDIEKNFEVIQIPTGGRICNDTSLKFHINTIFSNSEYANNLYKSIKANPINYERLTIQELITTLKLSFKNSLDWSTGFNDIDLRNISDLIEYESNFLASLNKFRPNNKPNPDGIMWPIPDHESHPRSKYDMLPYSVKNKIMNKSTPIGSAGSCFAAEIAKALQDDNFNYIVTELGDNPEEEAIIDGYEVGSGKAMYSANFGILFNTPSLKQLAEKAFSIKDFTKYLVQAEHGLFMDPYRENVYFKSKENYLRDYPKHINAIKNALLKSEVFIFTAGLNECWELLDGTVMSRNPRDSFYHLMKHKVLTVDENIKNIQDFFNIVKQRNPKFKLILTLSPVPLLATGRGKTHHIIEANTHSKSTLRVAIEEVVKNNDDIYYLPSYELVTECSVNPWENDHRHVTRETVKRIIDMFKEKFVM